MAIAIRTKRILLGLLGSPIGHSRSPAMHEAAARAAGFDLHYHLIDLATADRADLAAALDGVRRLGFSGINVTYPYKEAVLPLLDAVDDDAAAIGAVNTIVARDGRLTGHNTDATGFAAAIRAQGLGRADGPVAIVGAGGVGKAIGFALAGCGVEELRLFDTDRAKAAALAQRLRTHARVEIAATVEDAIVGAHGIVNGTPVGMAPDRGTPIPAGLIHAGQWVADAVYNPLWTPLLKAARAAGARTVTGRELSLNQAVDAFRLFTGQEPSYAVIAAAFDGAEATERAV